MGRRLARARSASHDNNAIPTWNEPIDWLDSWSESPRGFHLSTLLYIILKTAGIIDEPNDWINICHLLAMDSIATVLLMQWWQRRKG